MKKALILLFLLSAPAVAAVWDETTPTGNSPISQGDDRIREMKEALGDALDWSGVFPGTNPLTAPMYQWTYGYGLSSARPTTNLQDGQIYYATDTATAEMYLTSGSTWTIVSWGQLAPYLPSTFRVVGSSVGIGDTTPDYTLDLEAGTFGTSGNIYADGNITTTGDDVDITTNVTISGALNLNSSTKIIAVSTAGTTFTGNEAVTFFTEESDSLGEFNGSSATVTNAGFYLIGANIGAACGGSVDAQVKIYVNGSQKDVAACDSAANDASLGITSMLSLSAGDIVSIRGANGLFVVGAAGFDRFWMVRLL